MMDEPNTAADTAYESILRDLVERIWPADARLKSSELARRYGQATGVIREALIRLAAKGFVRSYPNQGFRTIRGTPQTVGEHARMRALVEVEAVRLSIIHGDLAWEARLAAAHHGLSHLESKLGRMENPSIEELRIWTEAELAFHGALSSACGSDVLIEAQREAFIRFRIHLVSIDAGWGFRGAPSIKEHEAILAAVLARDSAASSKAIRTHFDHFPNALAALEQSKSA